MRKKKIKIIVLQLRNEDNIYTYMQTGSACKGEICDDGSSQNFEF